MADPFYFVRLASPGGSTIELDEVHNMANSRLHEIAAQGFEFCSEAMVGVPAGATLELFGPFTAPTFRYQIDGQGQLAAEPDAAPADYVSRFPLTHRATAGKAYSDGYIDGLDVRGSLLGRLLKVAMDLRAATVDFEDDTDLDAAKAAFDEVTGDLAEAGVSVRIAPGAAA